MTEKLELYYRFHSKIYDATRWSFLFGRDGIIRIAARYADPKNILEIGCGTGKNLLALHKAFPNAKITGVDLSTDMLDIAAKKSDQAPECISLRCERYCAPLSSGAEDKFDLILFSYSLSMINPGYENVIACAAQDISDSGFIAVVDFNHSPIKLFRAWMGVNQVKMENHLAPCLAKHFTPVMDIKKQAYLGLWSYFFFLGNPLPLNH